MKKTITIVAALISLQGFAISPNAAVNTLESDKDKQCIVDCYNAIKQLLDTGTITIEEAQVLWKKTKH